MNSRVRPVDTSASSSTAGTVAALVVVVVVLWGAGRGPLAVPPAGDLAEWLDRRGAVVAAMVALRLLGLIAAVWMLLLIALRELAAIVGAARLAVLADRALPPAARRVLGAAAGLGLVAGGVGSIVGPAGTGSAAPVQAPDSPAASGRGDAGSADAAPEATLRLEPAPETTGDRATDAATDPATDAAPPTTEPVATMSRTADTPATSDATVADEGAAEHPPAPVADPAPEPAHDEASDPVSNPAGAGEWTVAAGESFWSIAGDVVGERLGRPAGDAEVVDYWRALIAANTDRLVGGDPDLIFPGQRLVLPG